MAEPATASETTPTPPPTQPDPQAQPTKSGGGDPKTKTFTESEVAAIVDARLRKHEKSVRSTWEKEQADAKRKAELSAEDAAKELRAEAERIKQEAEQQLTVAKRQTQLAGKVSDVDYALFKLSQNEEEFLTKDGLINIDALLKANPSLVVAKAGPAPTKPGGGSNTEKVDMNQMLRTAIAKKQ